MELVSMVRHKNVKYFVSVMLLVAGLSIAGVAQFGYRTKTIEDKHTILLAHKSISPSLTPGLLSHGFSHIKVKAGHTYQLSLNSMNQIVGASNVQIAPGTTGYTPVSNASDADSADPIPSWIIYFPDGTQLFSGGAFPLNGWNVGYNKTTGVMLIKVPANATVGTFYNAFYALRILKTPNPLGGYFFDTIGVGAYFDVT